MNHRRVFQFLCLEAVLLVIMASRFNSIVVYGCVSLVVVIGTFYMDWNCRLMIALGGKVESSRAQKIFAEEFFYNTSSRSDHRELMLGLDTLRRYKKLLVTTRILAGVWLVYSVGRYCVPALMKG